MNSLAMRRRLLAPSVGLTVLGCFALLYLFDRAGYLGILKAIGIDVFPTPFLDLLQISAQITCRQQGIDVYASTPCDPLNRPFIYSPLWLRLSFLAPSSGWKDIYGLVFDATFLASLFWLPAPRSWKSALVMVAATLSTTTVFALERGNNDLVVFMLVLAALYPWCKAWPRAIPGYLLVVIAALLKFYPLAVFVVACRERFVRCLAIGAGVAVVTAVFVAGYGNEILRAMDNSKVFYGHFFEYDTFWAINLLYQLRDFFGALPFLEGGSAREWLPVTIFAFMVMAALRRVWRLTAQPELRQALSRMPEPERLGLVAGAVLILSCFLMRQSFYYRGIHLLLTLPGMLLLASDAENAEVRLLGRRLAEATLFLLWEHFFCYEVVLRSGLLVDPAGTDLAGYVISWSQRCYSLAVQFIWWWVAVRLAVTVICFALDSPTVIASIVRIKRLVPLWTP